MRILVTGASSAIAEAVIEELLAKGIEVVATSRSDEKIKHLNFFKRVIFLPYDISLTNQADLFTYFNKPDSVIHLAWDKLSDPKSDFHTSTILNSHKLFLLNLLSHGLKDVNAIGTAYEYGLREGEQKEDDAVFPVVEYGKAKNLLRIFLEEQQKTRNFSFKWIRIFNVFGPGRSGSNLFSLLLQAIKNKETTFNMSGGEQIRDYLSVKELAKLIVKISLQTEVNGIINACSGKPIKLKDLIEEYLKSNNSQIKLNLGFYPYLSHESMIQWGSISKLKKIKDSI